MREASLSAFFYIVSSFKAKLITDLWTHLFLSWERDLMAVVKWSKFSWVQLRVKTLRVSSMIGSSYSNLIFKIFYHLLQLHLPSREVCSQFWINVLIKPCEYKYRHCLYHLHLKLFYIYSYESSPIFFFVTSHLSRHKWEEKCIIINN